MSGGHGKYQARCPAHDDRRASLSVSEGDKGGIVLHCHAGCETGHILSSMIPPAGIKDLMPDAGNSPTSSNSRSISDLHDYVDAEGRLLFQVVRYVPKHFSQRRKHPGTGEWVWHLKCDPQRCPAERGHSPIPDEAAMVLYRLPKLLAAEPGSTVFVVEGEKDVHALESLGLLATTSPGGAGKWRQQYNETLAGFDVIIIPDNDAPGSAHAAQVWTGVQAKAKRVRLLNLPDAKDAEQWISRGGTAEKLESLLADAPPPEPAYAPTIWTVPSLIAATIPDPEPLIAGVCYRGGITLIAGRRGCGKTYLTLKKAWGAAVGEDFGPLVMTRPTRVLYISQEMAENAIRKRVVRLLGRPAFPTNSVPRPGASNLHIVARVKGIRLDTAEGAANLRALIEADGAELVFLDALRDVKGSLKENDNDAMGELMVRLRDEVVDPAQVAFVLVHHMGKPREDGHRSGRGASVLEDVAETVIYLEKKPGGGAREGLFDKTRDGGDLEGRTFAYRIQSDEETWEVDVSIELGERSEAHEDLELRKVVEAVRKAGGVMRFEEVEKRMGWASRTARRYLKRACDLGLLNNESGKKYGYGGHRERVIAIPNELGHSGQTGYLAELASDKTNSAIPATPPIGGGPWPSSSPKNVSEAPAGPEGSADGSSDSDSTPGDE